MAQVPVELISHIVGYLSDDISSLRATSLVCSRLLEPTQKILFRKLELQRTHQYWPVEPGNVPDYKPGSALLAIFKQSPHLATYINEIYIRNHYHTTSLFASGRTEIPGWLALDHDLPLALEFIPVRGVKRVTMEVLSPWNDLPEATQQVLANILRSPSLLVLEIKEAPMYLLNLCRPSVLKFKTVLLQDPTIHGPFNGLPTQPERDSPMCLQAIGIALESSENAFLGFILDPRNQIGLSGVRLLDYGTTEEGDGAPVLRSLIKSCAASLRTLAFEAPQAQTNLDLSRCVSLEELVVRGTLSDPEYEEIHFAFPLMEALKRIPSSAPLECINMRIHHASDEPIESEPWIQLDTFLSLRIANQFTSLARVVVHVRSPGEIPSDELKSQIEGYLPNLLRLGLLNVSVIATFDIFDPYPTVL
ncbi:hypothetical protein FA15DRAFT_675054 [Coprinopsis marcescibilis]|uniref:F-box domain-containing protein n=1 Tax=Coprinopsis marcescibilis TaxID=230819 RepID=A0A5C3KF38_COPMA|nr:hypothetical protein FA15DRAFT_675054 [Coprinopsis marcescibilis]